MGDAHKNHGGWKGESRVGLEKNFISSLACVCVGESAGIGRSSGSTKLTEMGRKNKRSSRDQRSARP